MRFMMLVKATEASEAGRLPTEQELTTMAGYNEELVKAGVLLAGDGLAASSKGAKVVFKDKQATVVDGPFAETKELIAGFWIIEVTSAAEAVEWARRVPFVDGEVEVRKILDADDFGPALTPELREAEQRLRAESAAQRS